VVKDVLLDPRARQRGIFEPGAVERLLTWSAPPTTQHADAVWALLNVELWFRTFVDGDGVQTLSHAAAGVPRAAFEARSAQGLSHP
jgi:asparagine synthase (glutamine-hydrolysing)